VSSLEQLLEERGGLPEDAVARVQALVSDWQILADLAFADLLLCVRDPATTELVVVAQMRPYTAQTVHQEDLVGSVLPPAARSAVLRAFEEGALVRDGEPDWSSGVPVRQEAIPVPWRGEVVAVVSREANLSTVRAPSQLELTYLQTANELAQMIAEGVFPFVGEDPEREVAPRVGDGMVRLDASGRVSYASPNAVSAYRRLGVVDNIVRRSIGEFDLDDENVLHALAQGQPIESEVEARGAVVLRRVLPLSRGGRVLGALMLVREVTELRRHERLLLSKDATIREIHHRVKNNLQTVASLLRIQSRRLATDEGREALQEAVRRIGSIALVHETLSQGARQRVTFDEVAARLVETVTGGLVEPGRTVTTRIEGSAGEVAPAIASPLALVLSELVQNALEHAFVGRREGAIIVRLARGPATFELEVEDDGVGVRAGFAAATDANLGLQIAETLVTSELSGTLDIGPSPRGGTLARVTAPLPR
jgi:two-component system, sensor histidine kinase PdtaS